MAGESFVHLHNHTDASVLDGLARTSDLVSAVVENAMPAVGITDHGTMAGTYALYKAARAAGITPVLGVEAYLTPGTPRGDKTRVQWGSGGGDDVSGGGAYTHATLWASSNQGLRNLFRLSSRAYLEGFYSKPRADTELLARYSRGVIATTGCPSGEVQTRLRLGQYEQAKAAAGQMAEIFEAGNYFVEIMDHGLDIERRVAGDLLRLAEDLQLPIVATNDLHYVHHSDAAAHDALLCVQAGSQLSDTNRFRFDASEFYLKDAAHMRAMFTDVPGACDNTVLIAEKCSDVTFDEDADLMPRFDVPDGHSEASWFAHQVRHGLTARMPEGVPETYRERADYEITVITEMGFPGYFLVVADFITWAKDRGIAVGPGRGSVGGSLAAYALGITDLDPVRHGLLFERFLNPERMSKPDIDVDFEDSRRGEVIEYVTAKYGAGTVAQIATIGRVKAKSAIKDAVRVHGLPYTVGEQLTKTYPAAVQGRDLPLSAAFDPTHERYSEAADFRAAAADPSLAAVLDTARSLEGVQRSIGMHAAGVIMSREPLIDHVPVITAGSDGPAMCAFEYPEAEALGLVKMDFLGLSNLTTITEALRGIRARTGRELDMEAVLGQLHDPATYDLLARGDTLGVFQLDGTAMRALLRRMNPTSFDDIAAVLALYRPGPMGANAHNEYADRKNGTRPITPIHPELAEPLAEVLGPTYGLIVYQEQVMTIAQVLAGYSLGQADNLRRAMGKKKKEVLDAEFETFASGMRERGYSQDAIDTLWAVLLPFSDYAFNKAHSAGYGLISYATAWLKANYPADYMAALLTTHAGDKDKAAIYLAEARRMGLHITLPDINTSQAAYTASGEQIVIGLSSIKNVGAGTVAAILAERNSAGPYTDFVDFVYRQDAGVIKRRALEALIGAGAFDGFGHTRAALTHIHAQVLDAASGVAKAAAAAQDSLFADTEDPARAISVPVVPEWPQATVLDTEKALLGRYVSAHPLDGLEVGLEELSTHDITDITSQGSRLAGRTVTIAGLCTSITTRTTKKGDAMAIITVEDRDHDIEIVAFPSLWETLRAELHEAAIVTVTGTVRSSEDRSTSILADSIEVLSAEQITDAASTAHQQTPVLIRVDEFAVTRPLLAQLSELFDEHPGTIPVRMAMTRGTGEEVVLAVPHTVRPSRAFRSRLTTIIQQAA